MSDLRLPANWQGWTNDELRDFIEITERAFKNTENSRIAGQHAGYFRRLYRARLLVLRHDLDRRISRQIETLA